MYSHPIQSQISGVSFGIYSNDDIKELSVLSVNNTETFDSLGHATKGGLCDNAFGPVSRNEFCTSCGLGDVKCQGHYGHIPLALPVFNPFLLRQTFQLLRMCCLSCHTLLIPRIALETEIFKMEALEMGFDHLSDELETLSQSLVINASDGDMSMMCEYVKIKLKERIDEERHKYANRDFVGYVNTKNLIEIKQKIFKMFLQGKSFKVNKQCQNCAAKRQTMNIINNSVIILNIPKSAQKTQRKNINFNDTNDETSKDDDELTIEMTGKSYLTPLMARQHLRKVWHNEKEALTRIFRFFNLNSPQSPDSTPIDIFFFDVITVPPNRFRPLHHLHGKQFENERTASLNQIMIASRVLSESLKHAKGHESIAGTSNATNTAGDKSRDVAKFHVQWNKLQMLVNRLYDSEMSRMPESKYSGVKQILEKKEGLFRKHMMGKRVNFAARSVISPDPYIMVDEIGIPVVFATKLSYPQPVTRWNLTQLQEMVANGPNIHPGAVSVQFEDGTIIRLKPDDKDQRCSIADRLGAASYRSGPMSGVKIVNRHLITGDVLLLNRQPTLHKPSIMAHKARVLQREKTLRLHYANCKCYNADFDGDEMNAHFPQSEMSRAEAYHIASVNYQFLVPKDGSPLNGLIQDHIIAGVLMTIRGRFFTKGDYHELVYGALSFLDRPIRTVPPSIIKPKHLWSGKQIVTTLVLNIVPKDKSPPSFKIKSKISPKILQTVKPRKYSSGGTSLQLNDMCESEVIFRNGELLCGVIDKSNIGPTPYGLIHICYELYGGAASSALLTAFARICTNYLQIHHGFTLGIHDILVDDHANHKRYKSIELSKSIGDSAAAEALGLNNYEDKDELFDKLQDAHISKNDIYMKKLDQCMKGLTDDINNKITESCLPKGLIKKFPDNNLQMMIQAGAKGASVNAIQISCLLGQIELEGRRIPLMMSGRTLPSFKPYETEPRAGGFVAGRFMTGIRPQEFFFHCMAGREGLIDTAVKTSRSGYLQRCLIKHLEGIVVSYDLTVRDSDGSVVQLLYGEDGVDIVKSQLLKEQTLPLIIENNDTLKPSEDEIEKLAKATDFTGMRIHEKSIKKWMRKNGNNRLFRLRETPFLKFARKQLKESPTKKKSSLMKQWYCLDQNSKAKLGKYCNACPSPTNIAFQSDTHLGSISEKMEFIIEKYLLENPHHLISDYEEDNYRLTSTDFKRTLNTCYMKSLCHPGEAVGLLAAQSIGEPSTQMTLNTFHFAGRGEMNVTLGIPRLREILMTASPKISTPSMDIPFLANYEGDIDKDAERVRINVNAVKLSDILEDVNIEELIEIKDVHRMRTYCIKFNFLPRKCYRNIYYVNPRRILHFMETRFIKTLIDAINKKLNALAKSHGLFAHSTKSRNTKAKAPGIEEEDVDDVFREDYDKQMINDPLEDVMSSEEEDADGEGDTTGLRHRTRHNQDQEYEDPDDEEVVEVHESDVENLDDDDGNVSDSPSVIEIDDGVNQRDENTENVMRHSRKNERKAQLEAQRSERQNRVRLISDIIEHYDFDVSREEWCYVRLKYNLTAGKLDISTIIEEEANNAFIHKIGRIDRAFLVKDQNAAKCGARYDKMLKTEGVSFLDIVKYDHIVDINRIYSNDIHAIANIYGIEAAAKAIQREISNVFAVYGIKIDNRHLSLISDYMTFSGSIRGMNRMAMEGFAPIQSMTFETTTNFLKSATLIGLKDNLKSPSARIVVGRPSTVGTGSIDVLCDSLMVQNNNVNHANQSFEGSFGSMIPNNKWRDAKKNWNGKRNYPFVSDVLPTKTLNKRIKFMN